MSEHLPENSPPPGSRRFDRRFILRVLALAVGMFLAGYLVVALVMAVTAPRRSVVAVPDVRWMPEREARRALGAVDLEMEVGDSLPNPTVAAGSVVAQTPLPSQEVGPGSRVRVILSSGPQRRTVPDVSMLSREQATRVLEASGFRVTVSETANPGAAGRVLGTEPARGTALPASATVRLLVSKGPPLVAVPNLVGSREEQLAAILQGAGLRRGEVRHVFKLDGPYGVVLSQNPAPGDSVRMGSGVSAVVSTGELPGTPVGEGRP